MLRYRITNFVSVAFKGVSVLVEGVSVCFFFFLGRGGTNVIISQLANVIINSQCSHGPFRSIVNSIVVASKPNHCAM
jgi:hypothetical protein